MTTQPLNKRAMLVNTTVRRWWPVRVDKKASDEIAARHGSDKAMGRFHKRLISKSALKEIDSIRGQIRNAHYFLTLPWTDDGPRILSSDAYFKYVELVTKLTADYETAVAKFIPQYPEYKRQAREQLNGLYNEDDYPEDISGEFGVATTFRPMPAAEDFRVEGLDPEALAGIKSQIEEDNKAIVTKAMGSVWERMRDVLEHAVEGLKAYEVDAEGKVQHAFRDSLVGNIRKLLEVIPDLNITKDPEIEKFTALISKHVAAVDPDALRDSDVTREAVMSKADAILKKMQSLGL